MKTYLLTAAASFLIVGFVRADLFDAPQTESDSRRLTDLQTRPLVDESRSRQLSYQSLQNSELSPQRSSGLSGNSCFNY